MRAKSVRRKWLKIGAKDVTPPGLFCPETSEVVETQGLDIPEEHDKKDW